MLEQGRTESLGNDDISCLNVRKYEMGHDDVKQKMPEESMGIVTSHYGGEGGGGGDSK